MAFDPNEQRDDKGRWSSSGGASPPGASDKLWAVSHGDPNGPFVQVDNLDNAPLARSVAVQAADVANKLGFPPTKLNVTDGEYRFTVNGKEMTAAGLAYRDTGLITIYAKQVTPTSLPGIMAHEVMHQKFNAWLRDVETEKTALMKTLYDSVGADRFWGEVMKPSGELREPYDKQFPLFVLNEKINTGDIADTMRKEDGCSNYSREYWEGWRAGNVQTPSAYHETLAEMARIEYENKASKKAGSAISNMVGPPMLKKNGMFTSAKRSTGWAALYKAVNANWDKKVKS